jgi:hypothetical protein
MHGFQFKLISYHHDVSIWVVATMNNQCFRYRYNHGVTVQYMRNCWFIIKLLIFYPI